MKILVVDDDAYLLESYSYILASAGYEIFKASSGKECLEKTRTLQPDIILLDVVLNDISGIEVCRLIKEDCALSSVYIILISGIRITSEDKVEGLRAGAEGYLAKPVPAEELLAKVASLCRLKRNEDELQRQHDLLEEMVNKRTAELLHSNRLLQESVKELKTTQQELIASKNIAEEASKFKSNLLLNLRHEFRTPLNGIIGLARILKDEHQDEQQAAISKGIFVSAKRLAVVLDSLLDLANLESDQFRSSFHIIDLSAVLKATVGKFCELAAQKGLDYHIEAPVPVYVMGDYSALFNVLSNLIDNGLKFTQTGGVQIKLNSTEIAGRAIASISITDTGIGIKKEDQEKIFDDFVQLSQGISRTHEGIGLGLTLSGKIIKLMNGSIRVESVEGQGSTFYVELPLICKGN